MIASEEEIGVVRSFALAAVSNTFQMPSAQPAQAVSVQQQQTFQGPGYTQQTQKLVIANKNTAQQAIGSLIDALSGSLGDMAPQVNIAPEKSIEKLGEYAAALTGVAI